MRTTQLTFRNCAEQTRLAATVWAVPQDAVSALAAAVCDRKQSQSRARKLRTCRCQHRALPRQARVFGRMLHRCFA